MNIYKNLMFLHGHFVDPRDADDEPGPVPPASSRRAPDPVAASRPASRPAQAARRADWRQWWLRLWPAQSARVQADCAGLRGCA